MAERVMFVQLKTGFNTDQGPAWIRLVRYSKTWTTAYWHGRTRRRSPGMFDANFYDTSTMEEFWLSGPHRDRYSHIRPTIDDDVRDLYAAFLDGKGWPGHLTRQTATTAKREPVAVAPPAHVEAAIAERD